MKYERLTEHKNLCGMDYIKLKNCDSYDCEYCIRPCEDAKERLAELEDMIESGLLVELPCKVGDKVYGVDKNIRRIIHGTVVYFAVNSELTVFMDDDDNHTYWVKYVFTTKEAAEAKLKELRGE